MPIGIDLIHPNPLRSLQQDQRNGGRHRYPSVMTLAAMTMNVWIRWHNGAGLAGNVTIAELALDSLRGIGGMKTMAGPSFFAFPNHLGLCSWPDVEHWLA